MLFAPRSMPKTVRQTFWRISNQGGGLWAMIRSPALKLLGDGKGYEVYVE
jgi:hypothetical protein